MNTAERQTKQKKVVKEYLASTRDHPCADTVYKEVRKKLPKISKATVYRILKNLKKKGEIQEIPTDVSRWDYNEDPHPHFICNVCGSIFDIQEEIEVPKKQDLKVGRVENYRVVFCGDCKNC